MKESECTQIFAALEGVEDELEKMGGNQEKRQECYEHLMELRKRMDRCVELWLRFEEKINEIQEKYDFLLPDELPDSFLQAFVKVLPDKAQEIMPSDRGVGKSLFLQSDDEACIISFRRGLGFLELAMMGETRKALEYYYRAKRLSQLGE